MSITLLPLYAQNALPSVEDWGNQLFSLGGYGLLIALFLTGAVVTRRTYQDKCQEAEKWHQAYENMRKALLEAESQKEAAVEVALAANDAFDSFRRLMEAKE